MICFANRGMENALKKMWQVCFGDEAEYINIFFENWFKEDNVLVYLHDGEPGAMMFLLECQLQTKGYTVPAQYIYAACTLENLRGKGIMKQLISAAKEAGLQKGAEYTALVPAEPSLFGYYEKSGFISSFALNRQLLNRADLARLSSPLPYVRAEIDCVYGLYKSFMHCREGIVWGNEHVSRALTPNSETTLFCVRNSGYALLYQQKEKLFVREFAAADEDFVGHLANFILKNYPHCTEFDFRMPADITIKKDVSRIFKPYGMLCANRTDTNREAPLENGFLGLALD